jgi:hypothetical protein
VITHRYVGVVMGLLMLVWFLSGIVMLFVQWPAVSDEDRAAALAPIDWSRCCAYGATVEPQVVRHAVVEDLAGRPVLRLDGDTIDLTTGQPLAHLSAAEAWRVAAGYGAATRLAGKPQSERLIERDQWTVTGQFNPQRPLWRVRFSDRAASDIYVSAHTGQVVQKTDAPTRMLNWLGSIPHWLYPAILRQNGPLWTQVVVWTSLIGTFLTLTGLYLGIVAWRPWGDRRLTPFRGLMAWHHLAGLVAGVLTLTWVFSGLVSMTPFGFLEGGPDSTAERISGEVTFGDLKQAIEAARLQRVSARQLTLSPLGGQTHLMADGVRLNAAGQPAPLTPADLAAAGRAAGAVAHQEMITAQDAYYHDGHDERAPMPAWRVVQADGTRLYLDPASGALRVRFDDTGKTYRWLFEGLHRFDFIRGFDRGPGWAAVMIAMLLMAGTGVATGVWLGWRRIQADVGGLVRRTGSPGA